MTTDYFGPLFDPEEARRRGDDGMRSTNGAGRILEWKEAACQWYLRQASGTEFSADDLIREVGLPDEGLNKNNVVGAWINGLNQQRKIRFSGHYRKSGRIDRHTGIQRIWVKI